MTDKSDDRVGHLNTILGQGGRNLSNPIFKSSNAQTLSEVVGILKFQVDRHITGDMRWAVTDFVPAKI